ncbi:hypothetical protein BDN71DRAFT_1430349 [Pleurotus eryngii]|uniref:Uncharacterized protein n=1 Tax=Pleurotus eryngii TaxID=5323 RepID=A0A9P5ZY87_PLEER|nr:hypothetical protein BDN71DRAFT_1430349 [Pleurotus eryngii]
MWLHAMSLFFFSTTTTIHSLTFPSNQSSEDAPLKHQQCEFSVKKRWRKEQEPGGGGQPNEPVVPVKKTSASAAKKVKKDKRTSAVRDAEDKTASAAAKKKLTLTAKILKNSGAGVAPPLCSAGTGVQLGSATLRIVSDRARHPQSDDEEGPDDDEDLKDGEGSDVNKEPALVVDKGKGKGKARDLHNFGTESDKDSDADAEEEKDEEAADEDAADEDADEKGAEGEDMGVGDDGELAAIGDDTVMNEDFMATPRKATTSKRDSSRSPVGHHHTAKAQRHTTSHTSASSVPEGSLFPPPSDHLEDLQGASRTTGGFAHGNAFGMAPNLADFVHDDDVPTIHTHSSSKVILYTTLARTNTPHLATIPWFPTLAPILKAVSRKYAIVAKSMISM